MRKPYTVSYIGIDIPTFFLLLNSKDFSLKSVNLNRDFLIAKTYNPVNFIFKLLYFLRYKNKYRFLERITLLFWKLLYFFSDPLYKQYTQYLIAISERKLPLINLDNELNSVKYIKKKNIDLIIVNNWWILPESIINTPKYGSINVHPSKLPQYAGSLPTLWSLKNRDKESAVSYIVLNNTIDGGDIIAQHTFNISPNDDAISLEQHIEKILIRTLLKDVTNYLESKIKVKKQNMSLASKTGKYYNYMKVNWEEEKAEDIVNKINLYPYLWPLDKCFTSFDKQKIFLNNAVLSTKNSFLKPGEFLIQGIQVFIGGKNKMLTMKLFKDFSIISSIKLYLARKGEFTT